MIVLDDAAHSLVATFLASLYERQDLAEHLDTYHPDAWVLLGDALAPRADLDPEGYEAALMALLETAQPGAGGTPALFAIAGTGHLESDARGTLLRLPMRDVTGERDFEAAFLLRPFEGALRLVGCTVASEATTLSTIEAQIAGDLAQAAILSEDGELLLTPLDLAYRRAYPLPGARLITLPESRFTCQNSGECCQTAWDIPVPEAARSALDAVSWQALDPAIPRPYFELATASNAAEPFRFASHDGACAFHQDRSCTLHRVLGHAPVPVCATYPVGFTRTPEGICVWTYFTCPTSRANLGQRLAEREADMAMRARMWRHAMLSVPEWVGVATGEPEVPYEVYAAVEAVLLDLLADEAMALPERLARLLGVADALRESADAVTGEEAAALARDARPLSGAPGLTSDGLSPYGVALYLVLAKHLSEVFEGPAPLSPTERLSLPARLQASGIRFEGDAELLTRYVRQVLFRKKYLGELGIVAHLVTVAWSVALVRDASLALAMNAGRAATSEEDLHRALKAVERSLTNSELVATGVLRTAEYGDLVRTPTSGLV